MAKVEGLTFKDLIDAQKRLAEKGDARAKEQVKKLTEMTKALENQGEVLNKQTKTLGNVEKNQKLDKAIQAVQTKQQADIVTDSNESVKDEDKLVKLTETLNKNIKKAMLDKTGEGVNSNIIKMFNEIKNIAKLTPEQSKEVLAKSGEKREFKTIGSRLGNFKEGVKDLFTVRGFLDKTGIVKRGSGGIFSEMFDAKEARQKQAKARIASGERAKDPITGEELSEKDSQKQFEADAKQEQKLRREQGKLERKIEKDYSPYISEEKIGDTKESKRLKEISEELVKVNPSLAPEGFGKKPVPDNIVPFAGPNQESNNLAVGTTSEESMAENTRVQQEQLELLKKIEENTRQGQAKPKKEEPKEEEKKGGFLSSLTDKFPRVGNILKRAGGGILRGAKGLGGAILKGGKSLLSSAGGISGIGKTAGAAAVAVGAGAALDYGAGKLGVGKDEKGNDLSIDEAQDEANWKKMSLGQKAISGIGRGIEKAGDLFFLGNMSRQAKSERIKNETEMLGGDGKKPTEAPAGDSRMYDSTDENYAKDPAYQKLLKEEMQLADPKDPASVRAAQEAASMRYADLPQVSGKAVPAPTPSGKTAPVAKAPMTNITKASPKTTGSSPYGPTGTRALTKEEERLMSDAAFEAEFGPADGAPKFEQAAPKSADVIYNKSAQTAPSAAKSTGESKTLVNAPTTINKSTQNNVTKLPVRNSDPSYIDYMRKRFSF